VWLEFAEAAFWEGECFVVVSVHVWVVADDYWVVVGIVFVVFVFGYCFACFFDGVFVCLFVC